jgi:hypothetical protein
MARDFDGTNDRLSFGSDASIDNRNPLAVALWLQLDGFSGGNACLLAKDRANAAWQFLIDSTGEVRLQRQFSGANGNWATTASVITIGALHHVALSYDSGSAANDPTIWVDGVAQSLTESATPSGSASSDAAASLLMGETAPGGNDFDGRIQWFVLDGVAFDAAVVNRARWWGTPGGARAILHPLLTDSLMNKGTATANGTASGTTMASLPRGERCWGSLLGCGR